MKPETKKELNDSYHDLLDRARYAVEGGLESLEDVVSAAKEELQKLGDHTEEELHQLGEELRDDVREMSLQAHELSEGLRDMIDFEKKYLGQEIIEKIMSLADKTTIDMLAFKEELARRQQQREKNPTSSHS